MSLTMQLARFIAMIEFEANTKVDITSAPCSAQHEGKSDILRYACVVGPNIWDSESVLDIRHAHLAKK